MNSDYLSINDYAIFLSKLSYHLVKNENQFEYLRQISYLSV